ncbi:MAG: hypothetical protein JSS76_01845 [Bacteroidetes bacterium]|nr:hypothetical protein [Bacteroidota bacterium]MBS1683466.1 hypothetical protein [Bacteroidota bacterium]
MIVFLSSFIVLSIAHHNIIVLVPMLAGIAYWLVAIYFLTIQFEVNDAEFIVIKKCKIDHYDFSFIKEIRIKKFGNGGYGSMPYLVLYLKDDRRVRYFFPTLRREDFEKFSSTLAKKMGPDGFCVNEQ